MAASDFFTPDQDFPVLNSLIADAHVRQQFRAAFSMARGTGDLSEPAQITADSYWGTTTRDLTTQRNLKLRISHPTTGDVTFQVDCADPITPSATTLATVISQINAAYNTAAGTSGVVVAFDLDHILHLKSPRTGPTAVVEFQTPSTLDGTETITAIPSSRSVTLPYANSGALPPDGMLRVYAAASETRGHDERYRNLAAPLLISKVFAGGAITGLGVRNRLHLSIATSAQTVTQTVAVAVVGGATSVASVVSAINAAFLPAFGVSVATAINSGTQVQVRAPEQGAAASVKLFQTTGGAARLNDLGTALFGVRTGVAVLNEFDEEVTGTIHQYVPAARTPFTEPGTDWINYGRSIERYGGAGVWGPAVDSPDWLPAVGAFDGEIRPDRGTGISWVWNGRSGAGWTRAIPQPLRHLKYLPGFEGYQLRVLRDYNPEPLYDKSSGTASVRYVTVPSITPGDIPEIIDARDSRWPFASSGQQNTFSVHGSDPRPLARAPIIKDNFDRANTAAGQLGLSIDGFFWSQFEANASGGVVGGFLKIVNSSQAVLSSADISGPKTDYAIYGTDVTAINLTTGAFTATNHQVVTAAISLNDEDQLKGGALTISAGLVAAATSDGQYGIYALVTRDGKLNYGHISGRALTQVGSVAGVVPLGAATGMVLRLETTNTGGNTFNVKVYWPSSTSATHWRDETPLVNASVTISGSSGGFRAGFIAQNDSAAGGASAPLLVTFDRFVARDLDTAALPGLPEVSGARLRDIIGAVQVGGLFTANGTHINDCTQQFPLRFTAGYGLLVSLDQAGRAVQYAVDPDILTDGGGGGPGGGGSGGPTLPPGNPLYPVPSTDGSIPTWGGKFTLRSDTNESVLFNIAWKNNSKAADPQITIAPVDLCWNLDYLKTFNQRPMTGRGWGYSQNWEGGLNAIAIEQFTIANALFFDRADFSPPPPPAGTPGVAWSANSLFAALLTQASALVQSPNSYAGRYPTWASGLGSLIYDPDAPYTSTFPIRNPVVLDPVNATTDLPTHGNGKWSGLQTPPSGVTCFVVTAAAWYVYSSGSDSWSQVNTGGGGGGGSNAFTTFKFGATDITPDTPTDTLTILPGTNISFVVDPVTDTVTLNVPTIPPADLEFTHVTVKDPSGTTLGTCDANLNEDTLVLKAGSARLTITKTGAKEITIDAADQSGGGGAVTFWVNGALDGQGDGVNVLNVNLPLGYDLEAFGGATAGVTVRAPWEVYAPDSLVYARSTTFNVGIGGSTKATAPFVFQTTDDGNGVRFWSKGQVIVADTGTTAGWGRLVVSENTVDTTRGAVAIMAKDSSGAAVMRIMQKPGTGTPYQWMFRKNIATAGTDSHQLELTRVDPTGNSPRLLRVSQADPGGAFAAQFTIGETGQVTDLIINGNLTVVGLINGGGGGGGGGTYFDITGTYTMDQLASVPNGIAYAKFSITDLNKLAGIEAGAQVNNLSGTDADLVKNILLANANATGLHYHTDQLAAITVRENGTNPLTCKTMNFAAAFDTAQDSVDTNQVNVALLFGTTSGLPASGNHVHGSAGYAKIPWTSGITAQKIPFTFSRSGSLPATTPVVLLGANVGGDPAGPGYTMPLAGYISRVTVSFESPGSSSAQDFRIYLYNPTAGVSKQISVAAQDADRFLDTTYTALTGLNFSPNDQFVLAILPGTSVFNPTNLNVLVEFTSN